MHIGRNNRGELLLRLTLDCSTCRHLFPVDTDDFDLILIKNRATFMEKCPRCGDTLAIFRDTVLRERSRESFFSS